MPDRKKNKIKDADKKLVDDLFSASDSTETATETKTSKDSKTPKKGSKTKAPQAPQASQAPQAPQAPQASLNQFQQFQEFQKMFDTMKQFMKKVNDSGMLDALEGSQDESNAESNVELNSESNVESNAESSSDEEPSPKIKFGFVNEPESSGDEAPNGTLREAPPQADAPSAARLVINSNIASCSKTPDIVPVPVLSKSIGGSAATDTAATSPSLAAPMPDASLPSSSIRPPHNWNPDPEVLAWAVQTLDLCEWSKEDRAMFEKKYSTDPAHDHLFTAVANPPDLLNTLRSKVMTNKDYYFNRAEAEQYFYDANKDLSCGLRPLIDILSTLKGQGMDNIRTPLAHVFQSISSALSNISRGRRELVRRFVPSDSQPALYRSKPSHQCLFGYSSIDEAMAKACEAKKINKDLVHVPKKKPISRPPTGKYYGKAYKYIPRIPQYYNNFQNFHGRGNFHNQRGRWKKNRRGTAGGKNNNKGGAKATSQK